MQEIASLSLGSKAQPRRRGWVWGFLVVFLGAVVIWIVSLAGGRDHEVRFVRDVYAKLDRASVAHELDDPALWPSWHFLLHSVTGPGGAKAELKPGATLELHMMPHGRSWEKFTLTTRITDYRPGRAITLELLSDSKGKITRLLKDVTWSVELLDAPAGSPSPLLVRGTETATTANWRTRLLSSLLERPMMNQFFYPDLERLAGMKGDEQNNPVFDPPPGEAKPVE